jgi:hypothetical protein
MSVNPPPLDEKNFIQDNIPKNKLPFWLWGILFTMVVALIWGMGSWYDKKMTHELEANPFLQVSNRQMSLFLWQFPEHMRVNKTSGKAGYLPAFRYADKISLEPEMAEVYVVAPPELLFLYHTWDRLLNPEFIPRPIQMNEFKEFLQYAEEWQPKFWPQAPADYVKFANALLENQTNNPEKFQNFTPPKMVLQAFQGWKNFFKEGEEINKISPTFAQMEAFLKDSPNYARNFWRNIVQEKYPNYLKTNFSGNFTPTAVISNDELAPFLKVAFFNYMQTKVPEKTQSDLKDKRR